MLPDHIRNAGRVPQTNGAAAPDEAGADQPAAIDDVLVQPLERLEILAIDTAIARFDGNITRAAQALNISTSTIYRKKQSWRRRYGADPHL